MKPPGWVAFRRGSPDQLNNPTILLIFGFRLDHVTFPGPASAGLPDWILDYLLVVTERD
jgi:hypothetical protein